MTDIHKAIERLLHNPNTLKRWELAFVKSAAGCEVVGDAQARVIRQLDLKNNQEISRGQHG